MTEGYVHSLYHSWFNKQCVTPKYATQKVYGATVVGEYLVTYQSHYLPISLVLYDYMSLSAAADILVSVLTASASAKFIKYLKNLSDKIEENVNLVLNKLRALIKPRQSSGALKNAIKALLKILPAILLIAIAILIFIFTGIPVAI